MIKHRKVGVFRLDWSLDRFLYLLAQINAILNVWQVWHEDRDYGAMCSSRSHQEPPDNEGSNGESDLEYAKEVACSVILKGLGKAQSACVVCFQKEPGHIWRFPYEQKCKDDFQ